MEAVLHVFQNNWFRRDWKRPGTSTTGRGGINFFQKRNFFNPESNFIERPPSTRDVWFLYQVSLLYNQKSYSRASFLWSSHSKVYNIHPAAWPSLLRSFHQLRDLDQINQLWTKFEQHLKPMKGRAINNKDIIVSYYLFIKAYTSLYQVTKSLKVFQHMKDNNIKPSLTIYNCIIQMYVTHSRDDDVTYMIEQMMKDGLPVSGRMGGMLNRTKIAFRRVLSKMDDSTNAEIEAFYDETIERFANSMDRLKVEEYYSGMIEKQIQPTRRTFRNLIKMYSLLRDLEVSEKLKKRMESCGVKPDPSILIYIATAYAEKGCIENVFQLIKEWEAISPNITNHDLNNKNDYDYDHKSLGNTRSIGSDGRDTIFRLVQLALSIASDQSHFYTFIRFLQERYPSEIDYPCVAHLLCKKGQDKLFELIEKEGIKCTLPLYFNLVLNLTSSHELQISKIIQHMKDRSVVPNTYFYNLIIDSYITNRNFHAVTSLFENFKQNLNNNNNNTITVIPDTQTYEYFFRAYAATGDVQGVKNVLKTLAETGVSYSVQHLRYFIQAYAEIGDTKSVMHFFNAAWFSRTCKPNVMLCNNVLVYLLRKREHDLFQETFDHLKDFGMINRWSYNILLECCAKIGYFQMFEILRKKMENEGFVLDVRSIQNSIKSFTLFLDKVTSTEEETSTRIGEVLQTLQDLQHQVIKEKVNKKE